jgi:hypothetical protein
MNLHFPNTQKDNLYELISDTTETFTFAKYNRSLTPSLLTSNSTLTVKIRQLVVDFFGYF